MKNLIQHVQIKVIQFLKDCKIMPCKLIDAAINMSADLTCRAKSILIIYKKQCQIVVPQIPRKSIGACDLDQTIDTFIKIFFHLPCIYG